MPKISDLPNNSSVADANVVPIVQSGATNQLTALELKTYINTGLASTNLSDFSEAVDDRVNSLLVAGSGITLTYNDGANTLTITGSGGGGGGATVSSSAPGSPATGDLWFDSDTGATYLYYDSTWVEIGSAVGGSFDPTAEQAVYAQRAGLLNPEAIEELQTGTFSYVVGPSETKWLLSSWNTTLGAEGRLDLRESREPVPLRNVTMTGISAAPGSISTACFIDTELCDFADSKASYYEKLSTLAELDTKYLGVDGGDTTEIFVPGPYGSMLVSFTFHDVAWFAIVTPWGPLYSLLPIHDEISDAGADDIRMSRKLMMPVSKNIMAGVLTGAAGGPQASQAGLTYVNLPSTWSDVPDPLAPYTFRDDFMGASLDTATVWNRVQSTTGNVEIDDNFAACNLKGNNTWGDNGLFSQDTFSHTPGITFLVDVLMGGTDAIVGFHDGGGYSYTDFAHGILFSSLGDDLYVFENGVSRGVVGTGFTVSALYRVRITLGTTDAVYEIQGGPEYPAIGSASWEDVTPGTSASGTTTLSVGASAEKNFPIYLSDMRVYS